MARWSKLDEWATISEMLRKRLGLPNGSAFKIVYRESARFPKGRVQRGNTLYKRKVFGDRFKEEIRDLPDSANVKTVIETISRYINLESLQKKGAQVVAYAPDGRSLESTVHLKNWRKMEGRETESDRDRRLAREEDVSETTKEALAILGDLEEVREPDIVARGVLRALANSYGPAVVRAAIDEERL